MRLIIIKNGVEIDHRKLGLSLYSFTYDSPTLENQFESLEGRHSLVSSGTFFRGRTLRASFFVQAVDHLDFQLQKNQIYNLFMTTDELKIIDSRQPGRMWSVKVANAFGVNNLTINAGNVVIEFISLSPYAQSVGTTLDPLDFDVEKWQSGQGLISEEPKYIHNTSTFNIYNAGDVEIDPREHDLEITLRGRCVLPKITNFTTGDEWQGWFDTLPNETVRITNVRTLINYFSVFEETNRRLIRLAPGWNRFEVEGATDFTISFNFRFLYL